MARAIVGFDGAQLIRYPQAWFLCGEWTGGDEAPAARCLIYSYFAEAPRVGADECMERVEGLGAGCDEEQPSHWFRRTAASARMAARVLFSASPGEQEHLAAVRH